MKGQALAFAWYRFRATFGRRWGGLLSVVLLTGLVGGLSMGAIDFGIIIDGTLVMVENIYRELGLREGTSYDLQ